MRALATTVLAGLVLAACGDGDRGGDESISGGFDGEVKGWLLDNYFDEMRAHSREESVSVSEIMPSELVAIQEEAWRLIHLPRDTQIQTKTYGQIFEEFWVQRNMAESSK